MKAATCPTCHQDLPAHANRVSVWGMYDAHLFHPIEGITVGEVVANWREHNDTPSPAMVGDEEIADLGPSALCPIIVLAGKRELRRVGKMVHPIRHYHSTSYREEQALRLKEWRAACEADPDIPRLLAARRPLL